MFFGIAWYWWLLISAGVISVAMIGGWVLGAIRDKQEERKAKENGNGGADESWGDTVEMIVKEISNEGPSTIEVDMTELRTRLELEDVEIEANKKARSLVDEAVAILTDDEAWIKYLAGRRNEEVKSG